MMLTLQIAAGIILAYAVIANRALLLRSGKWLVGALTILAFIAILIGLGSEAIDATSPYVGKFYPKIAKVLGSLLLFAMALIGGICLLQLCHELGWRKGKEDTDGMVIAAVLGNLLLVWLVSWPILSFTILGDWYASLDNWSRASGYADAGTAAVAFAFCLWPILPLWIVSRRKRGGQPEPELPERSASQIER